MSVEHPCLADYQAWSPSTRPVRASNAPSSSGSGAGGAAASAWNVGWLAPVLIAGCLALALVVAPKPHSFAVLGWANDRFADYFKLVLSYPGGNGIVASRTFGAHRLIAHYQAHNAYTGVGGPFSPRITHMHLLPLTTLICLGNVALMRVIDPAICFCLMLAPLIVAWAVIAGAAARTRAGGVAWWLGGLASYPFVFMVARGNVYAGMVALAIMAALLLSAKGRAPVAAAVLLAIAVNIRPNAAIFLPTILLLQRSAPWKALVIFGAISLAIFGCCLATAHALYPAYTIPAMRYGLALYYLGYVIGPAGTAFDSSLYGGLRFLFGYHPGFEMLGPLFMPVLLAAILAGGLAGTLRPLAVVFLTTAAYCLGSSIFVDYHLLVFLAPAMLSAYEPRREGSRYQEKMILATSCLMLVPLNYVFRGDVSWQLVLHPALLLAASIAIIVPALGGSRFREWLAVARLRLLEALLHNRPTARSAAG